MRNLSFNFNNEVDTFAIEEHDDGHVIVPGPNGPLAEYASLQQFAEMYAQARDVKPDNLKNWTLVEHGDVVSFVLRAGTAGIAYADVEDEVNEVLDELATNASFHPLMVSRVRYELEGCDDVERVLALSSATDVAREVYDRLNEHGVFTETEDVEDVAEEEPVDERSKMEKWLDEVMENHGTLLGVSRALNLGGVMTKDGILAAMEASPIPYTVEMVESMYKMMLASIMENGIGVDSVYDALLVLRDSPEDLTMMEPDHAARLRQAAVMAGRSVVNLATVTVGARNVERSATRLSLDELDGNPSIVMMNGVPTLVVFDESIDERLEAEREAELLEQEAERAAYGYEDRPEDDDLYEDDDDDEWDEDEDDEW